MRCAGMLFARLPGPDTCEDAHAARLKQLSGESARNWITRVRPALKLQHGEVVVRMQSAVPTVAS